MAKKESAKKETPKKESKVEKPEKKGLNTKVFLIGLPLFIIQLVLVYFITANFLVKTVPVPPGLDKQANKEKVEEDNEDNEEEGEQKIFTIKDLIINPAGTSGQRLLLLSVGFAVNGEENVKKIEENQVILKDVILNTMSTKTLTELNNREIRDSLKSEILHKAKKAMPKPKIKKVYFSKYVLN